MSLGVLEHAREFMMRNLVQAISLVFLFAISSHPARACLWDSDTLAMERQRFPEALELISGKFLRHSPEFYQWRIRDRTAKLQAAPSPELYDDLAVAYDKTGDHDRAIALTLEKEEQFPGLYETRANLGTFYMLAGEWRRGMEDISAAIAINANAHFGREVYQKLLAEYLLSKQTDGQTTLPLSPDSQFGHEPVGFAVHVLAVRDPGATRAQRDAELQAATRGVLGMMRFASHDSPLLLEALGDLLMSQSGLRDAKQLAARAYLKASYDSQDETARAAYRNLAGNCLHLQQASVLPAHQLTLASLEKSFAAELADAKTWYAEVAANEQDWIKQGIDVDAAFTEKYYREPQITSPLSWNHWFAIFAAALVCGLVLLWRVRKARRRETEVMQPTSS